MQSDHLFQQIEEKEKAAREFGFYWEHMDQLIEQIKSECTEVQEAWAKDDQPGLQEEVGDLMLAVASLAIFCKLDPRATLLKSLTKFQKRYDRLVTLAHKDGYQDLRHQPFETLMHYWKQAKKESAETTLESTFNS